MVSLRESGSRETVRGVSKAALDALIEAHGEGAISAQMRYDALARFEELPVRQVIRGRRGWKHDLSKLDFSEVAPIGAFGNAPSARQSPSLPAGVVVTDFDTARTQHRAAFEAAFGAAVDTRDDKFASLALAFQRGGVFIWVPDGICVDEPIVINYDLNEGSAFPYSLVALGSGATATVIQRLGGSARAGFLCGISELVVGDAARLTFATRQMGGIGARSIVTRRARLGRNAKLAFADAELGAEHAVMRLRVTMSEPGAEAEVSGLFFANADQHVDLETEVVHAAGATHSETLIRSAGTGRGQGRYVGNIKILKAAHGADASLRDDALLLSQESHVDSIPALEIAANDVKAFHGATVGAISEDEIFYAQTRGLERAEAERMIALGFFEPAIARFPGEALREELRVALEAKLGHTAQGNSQ